MCFLPGDTGNHSEAVQKWTQPHCFNKINETLRNITKQAIALSLSIITKQLFHCYVLSCFSRQVKLRVPVMDGASLGAQPCRETGDAVGPEVPGRPPRHRVTRVRSLQHVPP